MPSNVQCDQRQIDSAPAAVTRSNYVNGGGFYDPDGDRFLSPLDVLAIVNFINHNRAGSGGNGEGESSDDLGHGRLFCSGRLLHGVDGFFNDWIGMIRI